MPLHDQMLGFLIFLLWVAQSAHDVRCKDSEENDETKCGNDVNTDHARYEAVVVVW